MDNVGIFVQVRLSSHRLPDKALRVLQDRTVIEHAMAALRLVPARVRALLTDGASADRLGSYARAGGFDIFAGSADDVLDRYCAAARHYGVETLVRATGDNPLVSADVARQSLRLFNRHRADYAGVVGSPYGTGVEVVRTSALLDIAARSVDTYEHEHVTAGLYRDPIRYRVVREQAPDAWHAPNMRVTLDTFADYERLVRIYADLYEGTPIPVADLVRYGHNHSRRSA